MLRFFFQALRGAEVVFFTPFLGRILELREKGSDRHGPVKTVDAQWALTMTVGTGERAGWSFWIWVAAALAGLPVGGQFRFSLRLSVCLSVYLSPPPPSLFLSLPLSLPLLSLSCSTNVF